MNDYSVRVVQCRSDDAVQCLFHINDRQDRFINGERFTVIFINVDYHVVPIFCQLTTLTDRWALFHRGKPRDEQACGQDF